MAKKSKEPLESKHIKLFTGDFEELDRILAGKLSPSIAIRLLVRKFINSNKAKVEQLAKPMETEIELLDEECYTDEPGQAVQSEPVGDE